MATKDDGPLAKGPAGSNRRAATRKAPGKPFPKGVSGNPAGRKPVPRELKEIFAAASVESAEKLVLLMRDADDQKVQLRAAEVILDRHLGKVPVAAAPTEGAGEVLARFLQALAPQPEQ